MENVTSSTTNLLSAALMFSWVEYAVCCSMLILSLLIGVYYGWFKKQDTVAEYMLGGKKMGIFPVTLSLVFSHVSGITFLGVPSEVYSYGTQYFAAFITSCIICLMTNYLYLPVFYELQLNSLYGYLELRFDKTTRTLTSLIFALSLILYIPVVIYIPALAFNQVTGISVHVITPIVSVICIFYTLFGGLKAVVWTDALQSIFTVGSTIFIAVLGLSRIGSISEVFRINEEGSRLELFNMDPDPFARSTFLSTVVGFTFIWGAYLCVHPGAVQRFLAVPTLRDAKLVMFWTTVGFSLIIFLVVFVGLLLYATYHDCDPVATKMVRHTGQLLPYFVMDVAKDYRGLTGVFISGVLSAALSTMSASLNTVAGTIYEDFVLFILKGKKQSETKQNLAIKVIVLILGIFCILMVYIVETLGALFQMAMTLNGVTCGALFGVFSLGLFCPRANPKGAVSGTAVSLIGSSILVFGAQYYKNMGLLTFPGKVTSVDHCPANLTSRLSFNASEFVMTYKGVGSPVLADDSVPLFFQLSYLYYAVFGTLLVFIVGLPVSYLTEEPEPRCLDPKLFAPPFRKYLPKTFKSSSGEYTLVNTNPTPDIKDLIKNNEVTGA